jgi:hypothetical protein
MGASNPLVEATPFQHPRRSEIVSGNCRADAALALDDPFSLEGGIEVEIGGRSPSNAQGSNATSSSSLSLMSFATSKIPLYIR